ncbi:peptide-N4-asparagine amidase [Kitasatospora sp. NPDC051853]|uniref:peptide-N4-asparagine amidase n=1 Tax=Kitasatospora sp. NPDC051853 TaxID=3364058 RepID=UPI0037B489A6
MTIRQHRHPEAVLPAPSILRRAARALGAVLLALAAVLAGGGPAHADFGSDYHDPITAAKPLTRPDTRSCTVEVMHERAFREGYGNPPDTPYAGSLTVPPDCAGPWSMVVLELHGSVAGRQYDRLFTVRVGGVEVLLSSTPEPSKDGIEWRLERDITRYAPVLTGTQPFEFDLANVTNETYTGVFVISASVTFHTTSPKWPAARTADRVLTSGPFALDRSRLTTARAYSFPPNLEALTAELYVRGGGACEEFAYASAPQEFVEANPGRGYCGQGPFRELRLAVDGRVAGAVWPYPVIYTGGWDPLLWRPTPGLFAFELPAYRLDLTPYVGLLLDGRPHTLSVTLNQAEQQSNDSWTGQLNLFAEVDEGSARTTGALTRHQVAAAVEPVTALTDLGGGSGDWTVTARRQDVAEGWVQTSHGRVRTEVSSSQVFGSTQQLREEGAALKLANRLEQTWTTHRRGGGPQRVETVSESVPLTVDYRYGGQDQRTSMVMGRHRTETADGVRRTLDHTYAPTAYRRDGATPVRTASAVETYRSTGPEGPYARTITTRDGWPL